ncbi:hypothetical protein CFAEC_04225 [Corynebacterium faecale]|nr:hypothetical protein CFAEC_04225 [Corynebacterium faecale]
MSWDGYSLILVDLETWHLKHPERGIIEAHIGPAVLLSEIDPGFPVDESESAPAPVDSDEQASTADEKLKEYVLDDIKRHVLVLVDGQPVARLKTLKNARVSLAPENTDKLQNGKFTEPIPVLQGPLLKLESNAVDSWVRTIVYKEQGSPGVDLDPPTGSQAARRFAAMAASPWKRVIYPLAGGLSKGGWALGVLIVGPFVVRFISQIITWIVERLPDFEIPWPNWSIPWPDITIPWPEWNLPRLDLPTIDIPPWLEFLLEYSKVWVPMIIGLFIGMIAVRRYRKSRELKKKWQRESEAGDEQRTPS